MEGSPTGRTSIRSSALYPLLLLLCLPLAERSFSQRIPPKVENFTSREYQAHSQVYCTLIDTATGRVHMGAGSWVLSYDGDEFEKERVGPGKHVMSMDMDEKGRLWVGCQREFGHLRPDPSGQLEFISRFEKAKKKFPDSLLNYKTIWGTHCIEGQVCFVARERLFVHDPGRDSLKTIEPEEKFLISTSTWRNGKKELFLQDQDSGLFRYSPDRKELRFIPGSEALQGHQTMEVLPAKGLLSEGMEDALLIVTHQKGIHLFHEGELKDVPMSSALSKTIQEQSLYTAAWGPKGTLCLGTMTGGLFLLRTEQGKVVGYERLREKDGLGSDFIWDIAPPEKARGALWVATNNGLSKTMPFRSWRSTFEDPRFKGSIYGILRTPGPEKEKGKLCVATSQGTYLLENGEGPGDGRSSPEPLAGTAGQCLGIEKLPRNGMVVIAAPSERILSFSNASSPEPRTLIDRAAYTFSAIPTKDEAPTDLLCSVGRKGFLLHRVRSGKAQKRFEHRKVPQDIQSVELLSIPEEEEGAYLIAGGMPSKGILLLRLDENMDLMDQVRLHRGNGLPPGVRRVTRDPFRKKGDQGKRSSMSLLLSGERGPYRLDPLEALRSAPEKEEKKLPPGVEPLCLNDPILCDTSEGAYKIVEKNGTVWVDQEGRLLRIDGEGKGIEADSIPYKGLNVGFIRSIFPETDKVWFGGDHGLGRFERGERLDYEAPYPCLIQEVSTKREKEDSLLFGGHSLRNEAPTPPTLPYEQNDITFSFSSPYPYERNTLQYRWMLEGHDRAWGEWKKEEKASYTNLSEGTHRFKVQAKNVHGIKSRVASYRLKVLSPWYRTWGAYFAYGIGGILFILLLVRLNSLRLLAAKRRLETEVDRATREIRQQKEKVEARNEAIEEQKERLEEAHQEITDSINYASLLQKALLPTPAYLQEQLKEHFILFKPQATVSGDFYWCYRTGEGDLFWAAVDCTGHGIPGAIMSMIGESLLEETVVEQGHRDPGTILDKLREGVRKKLGSSQRRDGMDMALCRLKCSEGDPYTLEMAGADLPFYLIRNEEGEREEDEAWKELRSDLKAFRAGEEITIEESRIRKFKEGHAGLEIKGDKQAVGYGEKEDGPFTTIRIPVHEGDRVYSFSDGYADQFGGPNGKKFRYGPFKELLLRIQEKGMEAQKKELDRIFEEWKASSDQEQIDDVLVFGVEIDLSEERD